MLILVGLINLVNYFLHFLPKKFEMLDGFQFVDAYIKTLKQFIVS